MDPLPGFADLSELLDVTGDGVHWTLADSDDLNANLVRLEGEHRMEAHTNHEVDVLIVTLAGRGELVIDGRTRPLATNTVALASKGSTREIIASAAGLAYLTIHRRRPGPRITPRPT